MRLNHGLGLFLLCGGVALLARLSTAAEPAPAGFVDTFVDDTCGDYVITRFTQVAADEYGNIPPTDAVGMYHVAETAALYAEARDDDHVTLSRAIAPATAGTLRVTFTPLALYPANGSLTLTADAADGAPQYAFTLAGGGYSTPLAKTVAGYPTLAVETNGPFFANVDVIGGDDGEGATVWQVQQPRPHTMTLVFGPERCEGWLNDSLARVLDDPDRHAPVVERVTLVVKQMECLIHKIEWAPSP